MRANWNFFKLKVMPALLAADKTAQTPATRSGNEESKRRRSSTTLTVLATPSKAKSARRLYSSLELHNPIGARKYLYLPHGVMKMVRCCDSGDRGI